MPNEGHAITESHAAPGPKNTNAARRRQLKKIILNLETLFAPLRMEGLKDPGFKGFKTFTIEKTGVKDITFAKAQRISAAFNAIAHPETLSPAPKRTSGKTRENAVLELLKELETVAALVDIKDLKAELKKAEENKIVLSHTPSFHNTFNTLTANKNRNFTYGHMQAIQKLIVEAYGLLDQMPETEYFRDKMPRHLALIPAQDTPPEPEDHNAQIA